MKKRNLILQTAGCIAVAFLSLIPLCRLVLMSFMQDDDSFSFGNYTALPQEPRMLRATGSTVTILLTATVLSAVLGVLFAFTVVYLNVKRKKLLELLVLVPFVIPSYTITTLWTSALTGNSGMNQLLRLLHFGSVNLYSLGGITFVLGTYNTPLMYLTTVNMLRKISWGLEQAARTSGCGQWETLFRINLWQAALAIIGGSVLAFLSCIDSLSVPAFLGTPASIPVLSTYTYEKAISFGSQSFSTASTLPVMLSVVAIVGSLGIPAFSQKEKCTDSIRADFSECITLKDQTRRWVEWIGIGIFAIIDLVPPLMMTVASFQDPCGRSFSIKNFSLQNYQFLFTNSDISSAIGNSLMLSLITCAVCTLVGTTVAYQKLHGSGPAVRLLEAYVSLIYAVLGIVLALAMIFRWSAIPGVHGSIQILTISYVTRYLILQVKGSSAAILSTHPSLEGAACVSGSGNMRMWKRTLISLLSRQTISSSLLISVSVPTEMTLSSILASAGTRTIGLSVLNLQQSGDYNLAYAFSILIVPLIVCGYVLVQYVCRELVKKGKYEKRQNAGLFRQYLFRVSHKMEESAL